MRYYHVVRVNDKTGHKVYMTSEPVAHVEARTVLSKLPKWSQFPQLRNAIEEVKPWQPTGFNSIIKNPFTAM